MRAIEDVLNERELAHGNFFRRAKLSQYLKAALRREPMFMNLQPDQREALDMIMCKVSRIMCGDPDHPDHWCDIAGYARLVEEQLHGEEVNYDSTD